MVEELLGETVLHVGNSHCVAFTRSITTKVQQWLPTLPVTPTLPQVYPGLYLPHPHFFGRRLAVSVLVNFNLLFFFLLTVSSLLFSDSQGFPQQKMGRCKIRYEPGKTETM